MSEEISNESLKKSIQIVGELYPILENQDGKILDGNHRVESNPKHHRKTVQTKNRIEEILVRAHAHHRRRIPQEETKALVEELAVELVKDQIPKNLVSTRLAELLPYSSGYIRQLLSEEFKEPEKVEAGKVSAQITTQKNALAVEQTIKISDRVECERCHVVNGSGKDWNGYKLCSTHYASALENPAQMKRYFTLLEDAKKKVVPEVKITTPNKVDSWQQRKAEMSPLHSKMEENVILALTDKGIHNIVQDREFTVLSTTPDIYLPEHKLCVYLDGAAVHSGREDTDEKLREMLKQRHDLRVLSILYEGTSKGEVDRLVRLIQSELKQ